VAGEIQFSFQSGKACYFIVRNRAGQVWSTVAVSFVTYASADYANYTISAIEQGTSGYYAGNMPAVVAGVYMVTGKQQMGGSALETDPTVAVGDVQFNGTAILPLSDLATSGQVANFSPLRVARGTMLKPFPIYLRSSADHVTAFTSGIVSGQISRDGGSFGPLQSGAFVETGLGFYSLQALTSGDTNAGSFALLFTAAGISGGLSDPLPLSFLTQRTSGN
jgi:hypothetical protein